MLGQRTSSRLFSPGRADPLRFHSSGENPCRSVGAGENVISVPNFPGEASLRVIRAEIFCGFVERLRLMMLDSRTVSSLPLFLTRRSSPQSKTLSTQSRRDKSRVEADDGHCANHDKQHRAFFVSSVHQEQKENPSVKAIFSPMSILPAKGQPVRGYLLKLRTAMEFAINRPAQRLMTPTSEGASC